MKRLFLRTCTFLYEHFLRRVFFLFDSETIHVVLLKSGRVVGSMVRHVPFLTPLLVRLFSVESPRLQVSLPHLHVANPIGLAAGFDYEADLLHVLPFLGFGFGTVGTLTNMPYAGNAKPRLGRLVRSRALLVNKGFKNNGVGETLAPLRDTPFLHRVGVSIGRTNTTAHTTQEEAVADIVEAFKKAEASGVLFHYYELNISCPNLLSPIEFYEPEHLRELLTRVTSLSLSRPLFMKMPITLSNEATLALIDVVRAYPVLGVVIGNLSKDRAHPTLVHDEVAPLGKGNLSGTPCRDRSDELIRLVYAHTKGSLTIVGCGGVMSAEDVYRKIRLGASLVELVTGLVFRGPLLPALINAELDALLARDGYQSVGEAVGVDTPTA